jgi:D-psicose/D-tagatose/L-ribulose 3-epimerase
VNLAISNLAWSPSEDALVADLLQKYGFGGVELAPTKLWPDLTRVQEQEIKDYRRFWNDRGILIVAMQSLLFGRDDLTIFGTEARLEEAIEYFRHLFQIAHWLGARPLVYGSPKNRISIDSYDEQILHTAALYFGHLAAVARKYHVCLCIEPLPRCYPCDFVTNSTEGIQFVDQVKQEGFGLHLDASSLYLAGENVKGALRATRGRVEHFHISEPGLAPVRSDGPVPVGEYLALLTEVGYPNWVSIEMLEQNPHGSNVSSVETSLEYVRRVAL